jgi:hypothetical protein
MLKQKSKTPAALPAPDAQNQPHTPGDISGIDKLNTKMQGHGMENELWQQLTEPPIEVTDDEYEFVRCQLDVLQSAWYGEDYEACKEPLLNLCEQVGYDKLQTCFLTCIPRMAWFLEIFRKARMHNTSANPVVKAFHKDLCELFEMHVFIRVAPKMLLPGSHYHLLPPFAQAILLL